MDLFLRYRELHACQRCNWHICAVNCAYMVVLRSGLKFYLTSYIIQIVGIFIASLRIFYSQFVHIVSQGILTKIECVLKSF